MYPTKTMHYETGMLIRKHTFFVYTYEILTQFCNVLIFLL